MAKSGLYLGDTPIGRIITVSQNVGGTDTSDATATSNDILLGKTAYGNGGKITGTIETKTVDDLTVDGPMVTVPAGYYAADIEKSVPTVTQATPTISITSGGLIHVIASQKAGYVSAGNKTNAKQLLAQGAAEYTPSTSDQTISSGIYLTGTQTIKGDSNLVPDNIKSGTSIFGVTGTYEGDSSDSGVDVSGVTATASDVLAPKVFVDSTGAEQTGTIVTKTVDDLTASGATVTVPTGYYASDVSKSVATATQATPSISVSSSGVITASATQSAGYVSSGTKSATKQLTTKSTADYTPSTRNQTIPSGTYLTGTQTILGDSNLVASNIKSGVSIFGVSGSYEINSDNYFQRYYTAFPEDGRQQMTFTGIENISDVVGFVVIPYGGAASRDDNYSLILSILHSSWSLTDGDGYYVTGTHTIELTSSGTSNITSASIGTNAVAVNHDANGTLSIETVYDNYRFISTTYCLYPIYKSVGNDAI